MNRKRIASTKRYAPESAYRLHEDTPLGARLRALFEGANNSEIARRLGVHNSTIHTIVVTGTISTRMLTKVATFTGCNPGWLCRGEGHFDTVKLIRTDPPLGPEDLIT
jgi:hypothetical protein